MTNEDADLLGNPTQPLRPARVLFLCYLLVTQCPEPARIRYAVASRPAPQATAPARAGAKRGT